MNCKKNDWRRGFLFFVLGIFIACPTSMLMGQIVTHYPYDQVGVVIGFSGVYDILTIHKFWIKDTKDPIDEGTDYYNYTAPTQELTNWLNNIAANGGNVIRFFSHGNWQAGKIPITPWKRDKKTDTYNCYPSSENEWNHFYWRRLDRLMQELKNRKLTAWIDIWDCTSVKGKNFKNHPFYKNSNGFDFSDYEEGKELFFNYSTTRVWEENFEKELVNRTKNKYNPIYSTNEVLDNVYSTFLIDITNYLVDSLGVQKNRISHSPYPANDVIPVLYKSKINMQFPNQLLLATHGRSVASEIFPDDLSNFGIKVISSDAEQNGGIGGFPKNKMPLTADEAYNSMNKALQFGFWGLELLDRDEYQAGYEEAKVNLNNLDANAGTVHTKYATLQHLVKAYNENTIKVVIPNGNETWMNGKTKTISWSTVKQWGTINIYLYKTNTLLRTIAKGISSYGSYPWTIAEVPGDDYRIMVRRIYANGQASLFYDISDSDFSITDKPIN